MTLYEHATQLASRLLPREQFLALRRVYKSARQTATPALRKLHGTFGAKDLQRHLEERIGSDFQILMVHSSLDNLRPAYTGSPLELVRTLIDFCGPERTLAMPAFCFDASSDAADKFNLRTTPSQMGLLTELFRRTKGVAQSRHPMYRIAALGPLARELTTGHEASASAAGLGTPFDFMARHDTVILGIGKGFDVLTQVHHPEDLMGDAFPVPRASGESTERVVVDGADEFVVTLRGDGLTGRRNMQRLRGIMGRDRLREWRFHGVPMFVTRARDVTDDITAAARSGLTLYEPA